MTTFTRPRFPCRLAAACLGAALLTPPHPVAAQQAPAPNPPVQAPPSPAKAIEKAPPLAPFAAPTTQWLRHTSASGAVPSGAEQKMLWLMNRARANPTAEGAFLAATGDPDVLNAIGFFNVNLTLMQQEFAQVPARAPAAFDIELWDVSRQHSEALIARDGQDHNGQGDLIDATGICAGWRISVFSFTRSALYGHAALNIDWGSGTSDGMQVGRGHRKAIMGEPVSGSAVLTLTGLALVPESNQATQVGPLVFSGVYCPASASEHNRYVVGTVWNDLDADGLYDEGEGIGGVTVKPNDGSIFAITGQAGGYAYPVTAPGSYRVTLSGGGLGDDVYTRDVVVGAQSVLLDLEVSLATPDPPPDPGSSGTAAPLLMIIQNLLLED